MPVTNVYTTIAPVNIAIIKYWGKKDTKLHIPLNSSLSFTLSMNDLKSKTSVVASTEFEQSRLILNGVSEEFENNKRIQNVLQLIQQHATAQWYTEAKKNNTVDQYKLLIVSENNFPTAAGLASSASGYCCLVYALAQLYQVEKGTDLSTIMRLGSGSACRSLYGGFVAWEMGTDHASSNAVQVAPESHWSTIQILIAVASADKKAVSSTSGMQDSVNTSEKLKVRASEIVPKRLEQMRLAILNKDFATMADLAMKDSDNFHECCADTKPPIYYMNETSHLVVRIVNAYNKVKGTIQGGYTFDAGPNAVLFFENQDTMKEFLAILLHIIPRSDKQTDAEYFPKYNLFVTLDLKEQHKQLVQQVEKELNLESTEENKGKLRFILHTTVGSGPQVLDEKESLITNMDILQRK